MYHFDPPKEYKNPEFLVHRRTDGTPRGHTEDTKTIHVEEKGQTHTNTLTRQQWAWMTNRFSNLDILELTLTRTHTHVCKYKLTSLFYSWQKIFLFWHTNTPLYIAQIYEHYYLFICYLSSCDKVKLFVFLTFLFLSIFFRLRLYVQIVLYIVELPLGFAS